MSTRSYIQETVQRILRPARNQRACDRWRGVDDLPHDDSCHGKGVGDDSLRHGQFRQGIIIESYGWLYGWLSERPIEGARLGRSGHPPMNALR